jgi:hypothetical protein
VGVNAFLPISPVQTVSLGLAAMALFLALVALFRASARRPSSPVAPSPHEVNWEERLDALESRLARAVQHVGLVRFDAFPGAGGRLSFSAALLDDEGSGIVLTAIAGREETRVYCKPLRQGASPLPLSPEEKEAVSMAVAPSPAPSRPERRTPPRTPSSW